MGQKLRKATVLCVGWSTRWIRICSRGGKPSKDPLCVYSTSLANVYGCIFYLGYRKRIKKTFTPLKKTCWREHFLHRQIAAYRLPARLLAEN